MRITTVQSSLVWEKVDLNLQSFEKKMESLKNQTDIIVLPEMFSTGFSMNPEKLSESFEDSKTIDWMKNMAAKTNAAICGSLIIEENGNYYNRFIWAAEGKIEYYDKRHLFTLAGEHKYYKAGEKKLIITYKDWRICPQVCYDLRFPAWCRNSEDFDIQIFVANWPNKRSHHWKSLLLARAIENQCYVVGVNRVGKDANDLEYSGHTSIIDFAGNIAYQKAYVEEVMTVEISKEKLDNFRNKLNFLTDRDTFEIKR